MTHGNSSFYKILQSIYLFFGRKLDLIRFIADSIKRLIGSRSSRSLGFAVVLLGMVFPEIETQIMVAFS